MAWNPEAPRYTADEKAKIIALRDEGKGFREIAEALGRSSAATVRAQYNALTKRRDNSRPRPEKVKRPCMTCRRPFMSEGHHNRMCDRCRCTSAEMSPFEVEAGQICVIGEKDKAGSPFAIRVSQRNTCGTTIGGTEL